MRLTPRCATARSRSTGECTKARKRFRVSLSAEVLERRRAPDHRPVARVAGQQRATGQASRGREELRPVRRAADDTAQHDDVGRLDGARLLEQVGDDERRPVADVRGLGQLGRRASVGRHDLDHAAGRGSAPDQLDLDLADAAADLGDRRPVETALLCPRRDLEGVGSSKSLAQVPPQRRRAPLLVEDVERFGRAAGRHAGIVPGSAPPGTWWGPGPRGSGPAGCAPRGRRRAPRAPGRARSGRARPGRSRARSAARPPSAGRPRAMR